MRRRDLLSLSAGAALSLGSKSILGANDRVRVGLVGIGWRGTDHLNEYVRTPGVELAGICDIDQSALERAQSLIVKAGAKPARQFSDLRRMLESKEIDAVSLVTPNHWHALGSVWSMQAGKDVYVEKPASHDPWESRQMLDAARKYQRMVQVGSQSRSMPHKIEAVQLLRSGGIGEVYMARAIVFKRRPSIGHKRDSLTPAGVDWNQFRGPAPMRAFNELRFKYNWHWFWDTGNGDAGNQGAHQVDVARWGLGASDSLEDLRTVSSSGGKYVYEDDQETPNTLNATYNLGKKQLVFDLRGLPTGPEGSLPTVKNNTIADIFYGANGYLELNDDGYSVYEGETHKLLKSVKADPDRSPTGDHIVNFIAAVRNRDYKSLHGDIAIGAASADYCHFANIGCRTGRQLHWDQAQREFTGDAEANRMLRRVYREPFVVPEKV